MHKCETCQVDLPEGNDALQIHENGKKHIRVQAARDLSLALSEKSIFIRNQQKQPLDKDTLENFFGQLGKIDRVIWKVDSPTHAIFEFTDVETAKKALELKEITLNEVTIAILPRRVEFTQHSVVEPEALNLEALLLQASAFHSFDEQLNHCINNVQLKDKDIEERQSICAKLKAELCKFFTECEVLLFGSSITSLGIASSDMDATVCFRTTSTIPTFAVARDKYTLLTADVNTFRNRRVSAEEIHRLTVADRSRFVCKLLNEIRKEVGWLTGQKPVLDARCPIVRFIADRKVLVDLSIDNELGYSKSAYLRDLVSIDVSQNLRKFLLGFRIWALSANLFEPPPNSQKGQFNAYMLYLMGIHFLQTEGLLPQFAHSFEAKYSSNWRIDYQIPSFNLEGKDLNQLFHKLFIYWVQFDLSNVVSLRITLSPLEQFKATANPDFKYGVLNLEDPFEQSHNVCQNLSHKMFARMRSHMMLGLAQIKKTKNSFVAFCSSTRPSSRQTDEGQFEADAKCEVDLHNMEPSDLSDKLLLIFEKVLRMEPETDQPIKRRRMEDSEDISIGRFKVLNRLWMGRRAHKKQLARTKNISGIKLEEEVSNFLMGNDDTCGNSLPVLITNVKLHLSGEKAIIAFFRESGDQNDLVNMAHFLQVLIPTLLDDLDCREERMET